MSAKTSKKALRSQKSKPARSSFRGGRGGDVPSRRVPSGPKGAAGAKKLAVSFERALAHDVHRAAELETGGNVSAWLAAAARQRLRQLALRDAVLAYEAEQGEISEEELAEVRREWPPD